ncbi:hypothetical protein NQ314_007563 [Rhamnusium bicolor]|uniref:Regulatory protein zeste n=1 Tax=Rhamnusium bicolor TaxID=1586634 RepID=A0AAV8YKZ0_9CUCU|nr:hypothetical protein NQ314_007563 [Rhamnusium bicolor]
MDVEVSKRSRNFTDYDRNLLFELVIQYKHVLENKKTDGTSVKQKNEAWDEITLKYNSSCQTGPRNAKQLHALYDGIKKKARKNLHDDKKNLFQTGGGTFTPQSDELDLKIATILKPQYQALTNCFDSSAAYFQGKLLLLSEKENIKSAINVVDVSQVAESSGTTVMTVEPTLEFSTTPSASIQTNTPQSLPEKKEKDKVLKHYRKE